MESKSRLCGARVFEERGIRIQTEGRCLCLQIHFIVLNKHLRTLDGSFVCLCTHSYVFCMFPSQLLYFPLLTVLNRKSIIQWKDGSDGCYVAMEVQALGEGLWLGL